MSRAGSWIRRSMSARGNKVSGLDSLIATERPLNPDLPDSWKKMSFNLQFKGVNYHFKLSKNIIEVEANKGSVIFADERLYLYEEKRGTVALVEPSKESLKILSTFKIEHGEGPHWAHPAIYNRMLFIRHGDVLMIYDIKK